LRRLCWLQLAAALLCFSGNFASAGDDHHTFWVLKGAHNTLYLLGSVHVLQPSDSDLPAEALRAYQHSKALVMELDLNDAGVVGAFADEATLAMLPEGQTLRDALGPAVYGRFASHVQMLGLEPDTFSGYRPWFAAMLLQQTELTQQGFEAGAGVDEQFAQRAAADHKPIIGLETVDQQLGIFANLSPDEQRRFVSFVLDDDDDSTHSADAVVAAWRNGDTTQLERLLRESSAQYPELFRMLTTDRNRRWLPTLLQLLHEQQDYLVIVGALHLVGQDGLVQLLSASGYQAVQH
jgi:hypothetical protein